jgi:hypothetical protein
VNNLFASWFASRGIYLNGKAGSSGSIPRVIVVTNGVVPQMRGGRTGGALLRVPKCAFNSEWLKDPPNTHYVQTHGSAIEWSVNKRPNIKAYLDENFPPENDLLPLVLDLPYINTTSATNSAPTPTVAPSSAQVSEEEPFNWDSFDKEVGEVTGPVNKGEISP